MASHKTATPVKLVAASAHGGKGAQSAAALLSAPAQFAYAPPPAQAQPAVSGAQASQSASAPGGSTSTEVESTHQVTVNLTSPPGGAPGKTSVKPLQVLGTLGYDDKQPFHISEAKVLQYHSTHPGPVKLTFAGLDGNENSIASSSTAHVDLDGKPVSLVAFPGTHYLSGTHGDVYSKPLDGSFVDTAEHAKIDPEKLRKSYTMKAGSSYVEVNPTEAPELAKLIAGSAGRTQTLSTNQTPDGVPYYTLTKTDADNLIDDYKQQVQSQFVRTTADKHTVTLEHFGKEATNGEVVAAMPGQTRSQKDANAGVTHGVTAVIQYKLIHPDGPRSGSTKKN
jgi:hypothetical protein